jgi:hypothetical protein
MTPTHTGRAPTHPAPPDDPRTQTALYHLDGTPFGGRHASPAGAADLKPGESVRRGLADLEISRAEHAMPLTTAAIRRMQERIAELTVLVEQGMTSASLSNSHALEAVKRATEAAARAEDAETVVVEPPLTPEQIAAAVAARRQIGLDHDPLVALADLVTRWIAAERQIDLEERTPSRRITGAALEELDDAQIALQRAVTP